MYTYEIIKPEEVMNALLTGDEVYYLETDVETGYSRRTLCSVLKNIEFYRIENIIANTTNDKVFIRRKLVEVEDSEFA